MNSGAYRVPMEQTLAIIKPDAVAARLVGAIILRIEAEGLTVKGIRLLHLKKSDAEGFYAVHREKKFFDGLTTFMSSGPIVVLALEAPDAIGRWRRLMGATDPAQADPEHFDESSEHRLIGMQLTVLTQRTQQLSS